MITLGSKDDLFPNIQAIAREKCIQLHDMVNAIEKAFVDAAHQRYGTGYDISCVFNKDTGGIDLYRRREVVTKDTLVDSLKQILATEVAGLEIGEFFLEPLPIKTIIHERSIVQIVKDAVIRMIRQAERKKQYDDFKDKQGSLVSGVVSGVNYSRDVLVNISSVPALLRRSETMPNDSFSTGSNVLAYVSDVRESENGPQIFLSRRSDGFLLALLEQEVSEIRQKKIQVKAVARDPGSRAKIAVYSIDQFIDPVRACVGIGGSRIDCVTRLLNGEKIDVVKWSSDQATFVVNSLAPAEVIKVILSENDERRVEVVVPDDKKSLAIGRGGQNVQLARKLTGMSIEILTETEEAERRTKEINIKTELFMKELNVDRIMAEYLSAEGFISIRDIADVDADYLANMQGFNMNLAVELQSRAKKVVAEQDALCLEEFRKLGGNEEMLGLLDIISPAVLLKIAKQGGVLSMRDLADLSNDELADILNKSRATRANRTNNRRFNTNNNYYDNANNTGITAGITAAASNNIKADITDIADMDNVSTANVAGISVGSGHVDGHVDGHVSSDNVSSSNTSSGRVVDNVGANNASTGHMSSDNVFGHVSYDDVVGDVSSASVDIVQEENGVEAAPIDGLKSILSNADISGQEVDALIMKARKLVYGLDELSWSETQA